LMRDNCALYNGPSHSLTEIANVILDQGFQYYQANSLEIKQLEAQMAGENTISTSMFDDNVLE